MQPLIAVTQNHARFLMSHQDRGGDVPAAIEQYRRVLTDANGSDSASLAEPLRMTVEFERSHAQWVRARGSAQELLDLQEGLSGNTSESYFGDLQTAAGVYEAAGDWASALPLRRKAITIADLQGAPPYNPWRRPQVRLDAAQVLTHLGQVDEAAVLKEEAAALQPQTASPAGASRGGN